MHLMHWSGNKITQFFFFLQKRLAFCQALASVASLLGKTAVATSTATSPKTVHTYHGSILSDGNQLLQRLDAPILATASTTSRRSKFHSLNIRTKAPQLNLLV